MSLRIRFISNIRKYSRWSNLEVDQSHIIISKNKPTLNRETELNKNDKLPPISNKRLKTIIFGKQSDESFKKLEFLGDAYIEFIISVLIFEKFPHISKFLLIETLMMIINNKNLSELSKMFKLTNIDAKYHKSNADLLEAYFGGIALENGLNTHYGIFSKNIWKNWHSIGLLFLNNSAHLHVNKRDLLFNQSNVTNNNTEDSDRLLMQLKNNRYKDVKELFNLNDMNDIDKNFEIERLQFLGTSALKFFITKLYNDHLTSFKVSQLAVMRDISLKDDRIIKLADEYLKNPSYSILYSIFNKKNPKSNFILNSSHLKQYLGYLVATHFSEHSNIINQKLFEIGWVECELLIKSFYNNYMMSKIDSGTEIIRDMHKDNGKINNENKHARKGDNKASKRANQKDNSKKNNRKNNSDKNKNKNKKTPR